MIDQLHLVCSMHCASAFRRDHPADGGYLSFIDSDGKEYCIKFARHPGDLQGTRDLEYYAWTACKHVRLDGYDRLWMDSGVRVRPPTIADPWPLTMEMP